MTNREDVRVALLALESELLQPEVRRSRARLDELLAAEFVEFGSSGRIFDKASVMSQLLQSTSQDVLTLHDFRLVAAADGQALASYQCDAHDRRGERLRSSNRSSLWVTRDGRWQLLFHQGTPTT